MMDARLTADPTSERTGALQGIRVLDFSRMLPGPWCTQMLGDLGADVIKVEQPGVGDLGRYNPPNFRVGSVYFNSVNLNKRSVELDLAKAEDRDVAHQLMAEADVVVESFRTGVPARLQVDYETARRLRPNVIYCSITGFGQTGPFAGIPGHDLVVQSMTGVMGVSEKIGVVPPMPGFQAADYAGAAYALAGILAALHRRRSTGEGCYLDISMFDSLISMTNVISGAALARASGHEVSSIMELWGGNPRYATYLTRDGKAVAVSLLETRIWSAFCELIGRPDLISPEETPKDRHTVHGDRSALYREALKEFCLSRDRDELVAWAKANDVPILPVYTPDEALRSEHVTARGLVQWIEHPVEGRIPVLANPLGRSGLTVRHRRPAPTIGQDSDQIKREVKAGTVRPQTRRKA